MMRLETLLLISTLYYYINILLYKHAAPMIRIKDEAAVA